jgi:hypothetical protein
MRSAGGDAQRSSRDPGTRCAEPPQRVEEVDPLHVSVSAYGEVPHGHADHIVDEGKDSQSLQGTWHRLVVQYLHGHGGFERCQGGFYRPPPPVDIDHLSSCRIRKIGHQDCRVLRPMVTPWLAQDDGDISKMAQTRPPCVGLVGPAAAGLLQGDPAAAIILVGQMPDESFQTVAVFKTPGPG